MVASNNDSRQTGNVKRICLFTRSGKISAYVDMRVTQTLNTEMIGLYIIDISIARNHVPGTRH